MILQLSNLVEKNVMKRQKNLKKCVRYQYKLLDDKEKAKYVMKRIKKNFKNTQILLSKFFRRWKREKRKHRQDCYINLNVKK